MNRPTDDNCTFVYYKDVLANGSNGWVTNPPPNPVNCFYDGGGNPQKWMQTYCNSVDSDTKRGVEWDWLTFHWELRNRGTNPYGASDMQAVFPL